MIISLQENNDEKKINFDFAKDLEHFGASINKIITNAIRYLCAVHEEPKEATKHSFRDAGKESGKRKEM
jgi:hypothetical protein